MNHISVKKGHNIRTSGCPKSEVVSKQIPEKVSVQPNEFRGVKPKMIVKEGDDVKIGSPLFFDKNKSQVKWQSPLSGKITNIKIGNRRVIEKIEISRNGNEFVKLKRNNKDCS